MATQAKTTDLELLVNRLVALQAEVRRVRLELDAEGEDVESEVEALRAQLQQANEEHARVQRELAERGLAGTCHGDWNGRGRWTLVPLEPHSARVRALVSTTLLLLGCGATVRPIARVERFGPWDQPRGTLCANGRPLGVELRRPPACAPGEEAWEQRFPNGSVLRECRLADRVTARHAIGLSTTGCIEDLERWRTTDGRVVSDSIRSWSRWTEHLELDVPCPQTSPCFVGDYRLGLVDGPSVTGRFDEEGRVHGRWVLAERETRHEVEFVPGAGHLRDLGPIVKADCVDGLVDGEFIVRRPLTDGRTLELRGTLERGLRHGPFRVGLVDGGSVMEGRYEQGAPVGAWTLPQ